MGWDNASTIAQEVEDPQRNYPRAMFASVMTVTCVYILPLAAVWMRRHPRPHASPPEPGSTPQCFSAAPLLLCPWFSPARSTASEPSTPLPCRTLAYPTPWPKTACSPASSPNAAERRPLGQRPGLQLRMGPRTRIHLRAPHLHRPRALRRRAPPRVRCPGHPAHTRAQHARPFRVPGGLSIAVAIGVGPALLIAFALYAARRRTSSRTYPLWPSPQSSQRRARSSICSPADAHRPHRKRAAASAALPLA